MTYLLNKRAKRRLRGKTRKYLDKIALKKISKSYMWSMCTWCGTRCPGCEIEVSARYLINTNYSYSGMCDGKPFYISAFGYACDKGGTFKCPGEDLQWEVKLSKL